MASAGASPAGQLKYDRAHGTAHLNSIADYDGVMNVMAKKP